MLLTKYFTKSNRLTELSRWPSTRITVGWRKLCRSLVSALKTVLRKLNISETRLDERPVTEIMMIKIYDSGKLGFEIESQIWLPGKLKDVKVVVEVRRVDANWRTSIEAFRSVCCGVSSIIVPVSFIDACRLTVRDIIGWEEFMAAVDLLDWESVVPNASWNSFKAPSRSSRTFGSIWVFASGSIEQFPTSSNNGSRNWIPPSR